MRNISLGAVPNTPPPNNPLKFSEKNRATSPHIQIIWPQDPTTLHEGGVPSTPRKKDFRRQNVLHRSCGGQVMSPKHVTDSKLPDGVLSPAIKHKQHTQKLFRCREEVTGQLCQSELRHSNALALLCVNILRNLAEELPPHHVFLY